VIRDDRVSAAAKALLSALPGTGVRPGRSADGRRACASHLGVGG